MPIGELTEEIPIICLKVFYPQSSFFWGRLYFSNFIVGLFLKFRVHVYVFFVSFFVCFLFLFLSTGWNKTYSMKFFLANCEVVFMISSFLISFSHHMKEVSSN